MPRKASPRWPRVTLKASVDLRPAVTAHRYKRRSHLPRGNEHEQALWLQLIVCSNRWASHTRA